MTENSTASTLLRVMIVPLRGGDGPGLRSLRASRDFAPAPVIPGRRHRTVTRPCRGESGLRWKWRCACLEPGQRHRFSSGTGGLAVLQDRLRGDVLTTECA